MSLSRTEKTTIGILIIILACIATLFVGLLMMPNQSGDSMAKKVESIPSTATPEAAPTNTPESEDLTAISLINHFEYDYEWTERTYDGGWHFRGSRNGGRQKINIWTVPDSREDISAMRYSFNYLNNDDETRREGLRQMLAFVDFSLPEWDWERALERAIESGEDVTRFEDYMVSVEIGHASDGQSTVLINIIK